MNANSFANLQIDRIIVHEVLRSSDLNAGRTPQHSEAFLELDPDGEQLICKRIADALGSESHSMELAVERKGPGSTFDRMAQLLDADKDAFVQVSRDLAGDLSRAQVAGNVRAGSAVVVTGRMGPKASRQRFSIVVKADSDAGFIRETSDNGVVLKYIAELVLGAHSKLFKIACITESADRIAAADLDPKDFHVFVYDHQMSTSGGADAARYFFSSFMGCRFAENASWLTKVFYEATSDFIDGLKVPVAKKVDLKNHLISYLKSQSSQISSSEFADAYIDTDHRDGYRKALKAAKFPERKVSKNTAKIARRLQVRRLRFSNRVRITAPEEGFNDHVQVESSKDGWTVVRIAGSLEEQA